MSMTGARVPPRARLLHVRSPVQHRLPGFPATASLIQSRHRVQARGFRFGRWCSHPGSECRGDLRSRHHRLGYKYISSRMSRALSWQQHPTAEDPTAVFKKFMTRYWDASASWPTGRYTDLDKIKSWSDELSGVRPGRNIEDVERSAINHLFGHSDPSTSSPASASALASHPYEYNPWQSPLRNIRNFLATQNITESQSNPIVEQTKASQVSHSHFTLPKSLRVEPVHSNGPPSTEELQRYSQVTIDDKPWQPLETESKAYSDLDKYKPVMDEITAADSSSAAPKYDDLAKYRPTDFDHNPDAASATRTETQYDDLSSYEPVMWREPDGLPPLSAEERSKMYTDLGNYGPIRWREPDGLPQPTAEELSKNYDDLHTYGPVIWNEPDGKLPPTTEELSKKYDDLHNYNGPYHFNEPDGKLPPSSEELSKQYGDLHKYNGSYHFNEPDGKLPPSSEELSKKYTDLHKYGGPFSWNEPDGLLPPTAEERSKEYTDLRRYGPVSWNEPDGKPPMTAEVASKQYTDLDGYGKVEWNEPDGKPVPTREENSKQYTDLDKYGKVEWNEPDGKPTPTAEENSKKYTDLNKYGKVEWNEPDGKPAPTPEENSKRYPDLNKYGKVEWNEPDGKPAPTPEENSKQYTDLDKYGKVEWNEPDGKPAPTGEEASKRYSDLHKYGKVEWNEPDGMPAPTAEETSKVYTDLHQYGKVEWNEPDGKPPMDPEESSKQYTDLHRYEQPFRHEPSETAEDLDALRPSDIRANMAYKTEAGGKERQLTGNYVRDFPEDFQVSWSPLLGQSATAGQAEAGAEVDIASLDESFPALETASQVGQLEPALNRVTPANRTQERAAAKGTGTGNDINGSAVKDESIKAEGSATKPDQEPPSEKTKSNDDAGGKQTKEPSQYKILAYDPASETVMTAETTSTVADTITPLAPPEVLQRLSNPVKFLPHLEVLEEEGYEMVSGSGDVLVFRKVRGGKPSSHIRREQPLRFQPSNVNPIDLMGRQPVTPRPFSASPTGYVGYDADTAEVAHRPPPPFRSQTETRPETGTVDKSTGSTGSTESKGSARTDSGGKPPKAKRRGKKIVLGALGVGGLSYSVGLLGEYFRTGGAEGTGQPTRV
ncbi:hypothetical protein ACRALDRAFT_2024257 [Sodiomyces alcalophilus JCM 7366]|uniref:uncharacterized protein n=1 Tax=Sodiomyces alcalophilus JCM 7366 TaxID=591952 RepID=UPI0039B4820C